MVNHEFGDGTNSRHGHHAHLADLRTHTACTSPAVHSHFWARATAGMCVASRRPCNYQRHYTPTHASIHTLPWHTTQASGPYLLAPLHRQCACECHAAHRAGAVTQDVWILEGVCMKEFACRRRRLRRARELLTRFAISCILALSDDV